MNVVKLIKENEKKSNEKRKNSLNNDDNIMRRLVLIGCLESYNFII
jgi:hypothetical protein